VSFQANKAEPVFRWFKYREGFSRDLVTYCLEAANISSKDRVLDPFAGTGATLFTAASIGCNGLGIELMPVGVRFMNFRQLVNDIGTEGLLEVLHLIDRKPWKKSKLAEPYPHLRITRGAYPAETEKSLRRFREWTTGRDLSERVILDFLVFSSLEEISYTRKDGQYLRWDYRAGRIRSTKKFDKGRILGFDQALSEKVAKIRSDLGTADSPELFPETSAPASKVGNVEVLLGSNFQHLGALNEDTFDFALTSPPYCNRYDYTRTYALELAHLGLSDFDVRDLRQELLTCTVENRPKDLSFLDGSILDRATTAFQESSALQSILQFLDAEIDAGLLNNKNIRMMVGGYFLESAVHIAQMARVLKTGSRYVMVNDNVQYNGVPVPVDCILSDLAESLGFECERIWVLPTGKGNSSQQMKRHGRIELRKCVYLWRRK
jgi:DNA modification methylase